MKIVNTISSKTQSMYLLPLLIVILNVTVQRVVSSNEKWDGPGRFTREDEVNRFQHRHLINMTENICKDAMNKIRQADLIQFAYQHTIGYELGILMCGIMEKFRHMIRMYRYYSNPKSFKSHEHTIEQIVNAYSVMQSDYSELIAEIVLYYEVLEEHRRKQEAKLFKARVYAKKHRMSVKAVLDLMDKGIDIENLGFVKRRSMQTEPPKDDVHLEELELIEEIRSAAKDEQVINKLKADLKIPEFNEQGLKIHKADSKIPELNEQGLIINKEDFQIPELYEQGLKTNQEESKKYAKNLFAKNAGTEEAEYKKKLRYIKWAEKWDGYNPASEGVHIDSTIARLGLNDSDFLLNELRGDV